MIEDCLSRETLTYEGRCAHPRNNKSFPIILHGCRVEFTRVLVGKLAKVVEHVHAFFRLVNTIFYTILSKTIIVRPPPN